MTRPGFLLPDAVIGLPLLLFIAGLLAIAVNSYNRGADRLAQQRNLARIAEQVLYQMQTDTRPASLEFPDTTLSIEPIETPSPVPGHAWHRVVVIQSPSRYELVGLVPSGAPTSTQAREAQP